MPPSFDGSGESFSGLILRLRGRIGLTQRDLAARVGVHVHSVQGWESGTTFPGVTSLRALVAAGVEAGGFTTGREEEEATELWSAAMREAPRFRTAFDRAWFGGLVADRRASTAVTPVEVQEVASSRAVPTLEPVPSKARQHSWGEAPDVAGFLGRVAERELLAKWVLDERCRVVTVCGLGGMGKSLLATRVAHDLAPSFDRVIWRGLLNAPTYAGWLADVLGVLAPDDSPVVGGEPAQLRRLLELLNESRCLLVLDNFETVLESGGHILTYRPGFERYGTLLRQFGETAHHSCLVVTSREEPPELGPMQGERGPVRTFELDGFGVADGRALLSGKQLDGDEAHWQTLIARCGGNGLALKVVGETIRELFDGSITDYLEYAAVSSGVLASGVRDLLETQLRRLPDLERDLLRWLAIEREPVGFAEIGADLGPLVRRDATLVAVEGLRRRSLLERVERRSTFTLQSVVMEYVTAQLIEEMAHQLSRGEIGLLCRWPVVKATAREHVRLSQERLIAGPLLERLVANRGGARAAELQLLTMLDQLRDRPVEAHGYGPGNVVNLLRLLRGHLRSVDLSGLAIRQAFFQAVEAQDTHLTGAHLTEAVTTQAFDYPTHVALSDDSTHLAAATSTGEVHLWRIADRALVATLQGHTGAVWGVAVGQDGRTVVSGGFDGTVKLWNAQAGRLVTTMSGHNGAVNGVALSADGRLVASGGYDATVNLWDATDGRLLRTLQGHAAGVNGVALSGDGRLVVSGSWDHTVKLWHTETGEELATLEGHTGGVWGVAVSEDGRFVVSASFDGTVKLWDASTGALRTTLRGHAGGVRGVAVGDGGRLVASGSYDGTVKLWDAETGVLQATLQGHLGGVWGVALSNDGQLVASASYDGTVKLWGAQTRQALASMQGQTGGAWSVALSAEHQLVASAGVDGVVKLWEPQTGQLVSKLRGHTGGVWSVALSRDGKLLVSGSFDSTVRLWSPENGRLLSTLRGHTGGVRGVAVSGDGRLVVSGGFDGAVRLWEGPGGRLVMTLPGHTGGVWGVAVSEDGTLVASGGYDEAVKLWDTRTGQLLVTMLGHAGGVRGVSISADRRLVASSGVDETIRVWDAETGHLLHTLPGHIGGALDVALSRDGRLVASGSEDGVGRVWDVERVELRATLLGHTGQIYGVAFADDGQLATASIDGAIRFWDTTSGAHLSTLRADRPYERMDIIGLTGVTDAQRGALLALGAVERGVAGRARQASPLQFA